MNVKLVLFIYLVFGMATFAMGQGSQDDVTKCKSPSSPDLRIAACTAVLQESLLATMKAGLLSAQNRSAIYLYRGLAYEEKGDHDSAIKDFDEAIHFNPHDERAYYDRGYSYKKRGQNDRAIKDFDTAIYLNTEFERAYLDRGNAYINKGDYERAIQNLDEAVRLKSDDAFAYNSRGVAYERKGDYGQAIQSYNQAITLDSGNNLAYVSRGTANFIQSNLTAATSDFVHVISAAPSSSAAVSAVLVFHVISTEQGRDDASQLGQVGAAADLSKWPGPILKLDLKKMTAGEVMAAAAKADSATQRDWQVCEANYFIGEEALFHKQRAIALEHFKATSDACPKGAWLASAALAETKRLSKN